jgi:hypothetical protein
LARTGSKQQRRLKNIDKTGKQGLGPERKRASGRKMDIQAVPKEDAFVNRLNSQLSMLDVPRRFQMRSVQRDFTADM